MYFLDLLKAMLVGVCVAIPAGPVLLMVLQKTLCQGKALGIYSGIGSALGDTVFASIGIFAVGFVTDVVEKYEAPVMFVGAVLIAIIGLNIYFRGVKAPSDTTASSGKMSATLSSLVQTFGSVLSNPAAIAIMIALLAFFHLGHDEAKAPVLLILPFITLGEILYWTLIVNLSARFLRLSPASVRRVSKVSGVAICAFAVALLIRGIILI